MMSLNKEAIDGIYINVIRNKRSIKIIKDKWAICVDKNGNTPIWFWSGQRWFYKYKDGLSLCCDLRLSGRLINE